LAIGDNGGGGRREERGERREERGERREERGERRGERFAWLDVSGQAPPAIRLRRTVG
jgi:hypothetical protein